MVLLLVADDDNNNMINNVSSIAMTCLIYIFRIFCLYTIVFTILASLMAVHQERKIWLDRGGGKTTAPPRVPPLPWYGLVKVFFFNVFWMMFCTIGAIVIVLKKIVTFGMSDISYDAHCGVEHFVAKLVISLFIGTVKVIGKENLPKEEDTMIPAPVYVANHASQIDVGVVYFLHRRFKWISKSSVFLLPGVGMTMYMAQHVFINRRKGKNTSSRNNLFDKSKEAVQSGIPMFFFPQGTRRMTERLPFKDGAFIIAMENKCPLIPLSIEIPKHSWSSFPPILSSLFNSNSNIPEVIITVHKPINLQQQEKVDKEQLKQQCFDQIYSVLPDTWSDSSVVSSSSSSSPPSAEKKHN